MIVVAVALYPAGVMPQPAIGTARWWELRPAWFALLTVVLVPLVAAIMRAERPMSRLRGRPRRDLLTGRAPAARAKPQVRGPQQPREPPKAA